MDIFFEKIFQTQCGHTMYATNFTALQASVQNLFESLFSCDFCFVLLSDAVFSVSFQAAILQQTAEYIYALEQEKTVLLSQNCHLKRLVHQHEGGELPPKKRKTEAVIISAISESSDEGLGSMSPEMSGSAVTSADKIAELQLALEQERQLRLAAEEAQHQLESQLYQTQIFHVEEQDDISLQIVGPESVPPVGHTQTVVCSPINSRSSSPTPPSPDEQRLPSVLEAAIKAEPKVEVERLPSPNRECTDSDGQTRMFVSNTSRQNLETIVEAIRHLEGDHMFGDEPQAQEVPLALITTRAVGEAVKVETTPQTFVEFHHTPASIQHQQQSRPGVIVGKQLALSWLSSGASFLYERHN